MHLSLEKSRTDVRLILEVTPQQIGTPELQTLLDNFALTAQPVLVIECSARPKVDFQAMAHVVMNVPELSSLPKQRSYREPAYQSPRFGPPHPGKVRGPQR